MITPILEKLILSGEAIVKVHNHGVSGVGTITVPDGKTIIITQIIWNPFIDVKDTATKNYSIFNESGSFLHTLKMRNKQDRHAYTFRDTLKSTPYITDTLTGKTSNIFHAERPTVIDTFLKFNGEVQIDVSRGRDYSRWNVTHGLLPSVSNEPTAREGYGTVDSPVFLRGTPVTLVDFLYLTASPAPPREVVPLGFKRSGIAPPYGLITKEFEVGEYIENPPQHNIGEGQPKDTDIFNFPIITFTYVEINTRYILDNILKKAF